MANEYVTSPVIREMQMKILMSFYFISLEKISRRLNSHGEWKFMRVPAGASILENKRAALNWNKEISGLWYYIVFKSMFWCATA